MGKKILITGASRGVGRGIALSLASGNDLLITGFQSAEKLQLLSEEIVELGGHAFPFIGNLGDPKETERLSLYAAEVFGSEIDVLINNAGISHVELFQDSSEEHYEEILNVNLNSVIRLTKSIVPMMIAKKRGHILNISSDFGIFGASCEVEYSVTKGAVNTFTKALAKELAPSGIRVNALALGAIDTEMNARLSDEERDLLTDEIPMGRMGRPEEVGEMVKLLIEAPEYLTGAIIPFDGAWM